MSLAKNKKQNLYNMFNWGKLLVLVFCVASVLPMFILVLGAIAYQSGYSSGCTYKNTVLGNLTDLWN